MKNIVGSMLCYLMIGGMLAGLAINHEATRCGGPQSLTREYATVVLLWPAAVTTAVFVKSNAIKRDLCVE